MHTNVEGQAQGTRDQSVAVDDARPQDDARVGETLAHRLLRLRLALDVAAQEQVCGKGGSGKNGTSLIKATHW